MDQTGRDKLESKGWQVGTATDFLNLTPEDLLIIEVKLALARWLEERQQEGGSGVIAPKKSIPTQPEYSNSKQSTSIDQLIRDMIAIGASPQEIGQLIASIDIAIVA